MKIDSTRDQILEFLIEVEGADLSELIPRLVIHGKNMSLCFDGFIKDKEINENEFHKFLPESKEKRCIFEIPALEKYFKNENIKADIEVILGDRYSKPWSSKLELFRPVSIKINEIINKPITEVKIKDVKLNEKFENVYIPRKKIIYKDINGNKQEVIINKVLKNEKEKIILEVFQNNKTKTIKLKK